MPGAKVVLVDERDAPVGAADKLTAHRLGQLHRAFSILVFGEPGLLIQQRAAGKYHSGGLWSNTCCGHPGPGEVTLAAAQRRLKQEMGISVELDEVVQLSYRLTIDGLVEHELNHVLVGWTDATPVPDASEVSSWRWIAPAALHHDLREHRSRYTAWLPLVWDRLIRAASLPDNGESDPSILTSLGALKALEPGSATT